VVSSNPRGFLNPYIQLALGVALVTASELCVKRGAVMAAVGDGGLDWSGAALASPWVWASLVLYAASFACWLIALRYLPLAAAYNMSQLDHALVPLAAWLILGEPVSLQRWLGIGLVLLGVWIIAKPRVKFGELL
jgi:multidrug transporter EmrE-like cation transporter